MTKRMGRSLARREGSRQWAGFGANGFRGAFPLVAGVFVFLGTASSGCNGQGDAGGPATDAHAGTGGGTSAGTGSASGSGGGSTPGTGGTVTGTGGSGTGGGPATGTGGAILGGSGGKAAGTGGVRGTGGTVGSGGAAATGGRGVGGGAVTPPGSPVLPPIADTCPTLTTGTATIGGLAGISLQVGTKSQGTGTLLFYWHGTGSSASEVNALLPAAVRQEILGGGGIIVSFDKSLGTGGDCSGTGIFSKGDFAITDLIAACAVRDQGIDPHRIYTTGCSAGGLQAGCMGALRSSYIAATVPNSGGEVTRLPIQDPAHVPAVMTMHGGTSDMVVVSFSMTSATYDTQMKAAGSFVVNCNHGGGHCGAPAALYSAGWEFMKAHPFGVAPEPYTSALPTTFPTYCAKF